MTDKTYAKLEAWRDSRWGVALFYGYLAAILITGTLAVSAIYSNRHTALDAKRGLCALKDERQIRVNQYRHVLENPTFPDNAAVINSLGSPVLLRSYDQAKNDLAALEDVDC